ncbi:tRNA (pseudouridine(54)-N(1))-methyltransferase TrmY [Halomarina oriensis]|uniref:tRNA (pseudouridine(54)-N(1))-methyltransferase n=1 Tax=Halomarina oriensis TaxID=671145 RepID=A0A6B0GPM1_9EURY|nr:tRNA (pseudouridine(54)-N(1))-methyltransferase TrmY [Halomarina oriensis]MWG36816.1 tRNA (pseudouridine(54)-N(1))-methyltransferase TrmY [Halomarina oriensis]
MRQFIVSGHDVPTDGDFSLDDLPGAGRLDVLCRCVNAAFFLSHDIREETRCLLVLDDEFTVRFEGSELRRLNPDERSTAALIRNALDQREEAIGHVEAETSPGVSISRRDFETTLDYAEHEGTIVQLHENGDPLADVDPPEHPVYVLSDHGAFTDHEADLLADRADRRVRVGPEVLHANHTIVVAHHHLDTAGYTTF